MEEDGILDISKIKFEVKINEKGKMLAQVNLIYGELVIKGYRVMKSTYESKYFIEPPSTRNRFGSYTKMVFIENPTKWKLIQEKIEQSYKKAYENYQKETKDLPVEKYDVIDPNEIPL